MLSWLYKLIKHSFISEGYNSQFLFFIRWFNQGSLTREVSKTACIGFVYTKLIDNLHTNLPSETK